MNTVHSFQQAITASNGGKRHLLLGNGFSIACRPGIFHYGKLFERADFSNLGGAAQATFGALHTSDFERVIKVLRDAAAIVGAYGVDPKIAGQMRNDAEELKGILVRAIASSHPDKPSDISNEEYVACQRFLANFDPKTGHIYSLNYDLLLYWTQMHYEDRSLVTSDDGFRTSDIDVDTGTTSDYVVWEPDRHGQNTFFLHGGLHIFDSGTEMQKYTWSRTGVRLTTQIRDALDDNLFPVFVAEGTSDEKLERVKHNDYLAKGRRSFVEIRGSLFIHGHSLAPNDDHFLKLIPRGKLEKVFVSLHGDPGSPVNREIMNRAKALETARKGKKALTVEFYDAASAKVWG